ncbi:cell division protein ZapA [Sphingomonas sp.]|uniref:cell division protein ZapA n=1 Tax=Sphingomonas sp. TaxID=28214 RepID=UPI00333EFE34
MADVTLTIGDRRHIVACPDGQEDQVRRLGTMLDAHWLTAARASGGLNGERTMLFVALMLADALEEADRRPTAAKDEAVLARIAARLESLAASLEQ